MGLIARLFGRFRRSAADDDERLWSGSPWSAHSVTGIDVNQQTALNATTVMAAVTMLAEDFAKLTPAVYRRKPNGSRVVATDHELYPLLYRPNDWQNYFEWAEMMMLSLIMRGNAYAVRIRNWRGVTIKLIPVNADWVSLWEAPDGGLFYRVTPNGLHMMAELAGQPFLIPAEDMVHVRGFSLNGLVGASRIVLAREAIGLTLGYERQAAYYMSQGASLSGLLTTDQKLAPEAAARMSADWKTQKGGVQNAGKIVVLEQGLKYQPTVLSAVDAQFIAARGMQIQEITRIFRIPAHMLGDLARSTNNNIAQLSQEYINLTMSGYTKRWAWVLDIAFDLRAQGLFIDYDLSQLTRADKTSRYNDYARGIMGGFLTPNEARLDDGLDPDPAGDKLLEPANMSAMGSQSSGTGADGGGRPPEAEAPVGQPKRRIDDVEEREWDESKHPRAKDGKFGSGDGKETVGAKHLKTHGVTGSDKIKVLSSRVKKYAGFATVEDFIAAHAKGRAHALRLLAADHKAGKIAFEAAESEAPKTLGKVEDAASKAKQETQEPKTSKTDLPPKTYQEPDRSKLKEVSSDFQHGDYIIALNNSKKYPSGITVGDYVKNHPKGEAAAMKDIIADHKAGKIQIERPIANFPPKAAGQVSKSKTEQPKLPDNLSPDIKFGEGISKKFANEVSDTWENKIPSGVKDLLKMGGVKVAAPVKLTDAVPELKGVQPRGWPEGSTADESSGVFIGGTASWNDSTGSNPLVVVAQEHALRGFKTAYPTEEPARTLAHETGHAVDYSLGGESQRKPFRDVYEADKQSYLNSGGQIDDDRYAYFLSSGDTGPSEMFAEMFANRVGVPTAGRTPSLSDTFPNVSKYMDSLIGRYR